MTTKMNDDTAALSQRLEVRYRYKLVNPDKKPATDYFRSTTRKQRECLSEDTGFR